MDTHSCNTAYPVQLYSVAELKAASGATERLALASAWADDFYGAGTGNGGWKGGAVSTALGLAIPGSGKENGAAYTAFSVPSLGWKAGETAFSVEGVGDAGFDGLDFNAAGTVLYANQYAKGSRNKILAYDTSALKSGHTFTLLSTKTVSGVSRIRNLSCYTVAGRDLVYFGEGKVSGSNNAVYVYDPAEDTVTTLVTDATLFDKDIMNVKLSHVASGCPTLYVQTDGGKLHVFFLAPDGKRVTSKTPVRSFTAAECTALCGLSSKPGKFRNFEVTDDGETAFFTANGDAPLTVVASAYTGDAYIETAPAYTVQRSGNAIFTDYFFTANTRIEVEYAFRDNVNGFIFSPWEKSGNYSGLWRDGGTYKLFAGNKWNITGPAKTTADANVRHTIVLDAKNKEAYLETDGVKETFDVSGCTFSTSNWPLMFLGAATTYDGVRSVNTTHYARARIYRAKIMENGVLVRDYVPAVVNGVPCLYDTVNGSIAADTRDGVAPPNVVGDVRRVTGETYVQLTSATGDTTNKGINTGYKMKGTSRVELDCHVAASTPGDSRPMGAWNHASSFKCLIYVHQQCVEAFLNVPYGDHVYTYANVAGQRQTFVFDAPAATTYIERDGVVQTAAATKAPPAADAEAPEPLAVFADCNSADGTAFISPALGMKAYSMTIKEDGATVTNFVPFLAIEGACLKDAITGETIKPSKPVYFSYRVETEPKEGYVMKTTDVANAGFKTGWQLNPLSKFEIDFALGKTGNGQRIAGAWTGGNNKLRTLFWTDGGHFKFFVNSAGGDFSTTETTNTKRHRFGIDYTTDETPTGYYWTGETLTQSDAGTAITDAKDLSNHLCLFADNNNNNTTSFAQSTSRGARFWGLKGYVEDELVHDWVPAKSGDAVGIGDKCTGLLLEADPDNFAVAGDLWECTSDAYVETTGGTVLDTKYKAKKTTRIEVDMTPTATSGCLFGVYGSGSEAYTMWCQDNHIESMMKNGNVDAPHFFSPGGCRFVGVLDFVSQTGYVVVNGKKLDGFIADLSGKSFAADWESPYSLGVCGSIKNDTEISTGPAPAKMRCYAVRIYEDDELVRLFLPYKGADGVGMRDVLTGAKALKHAASTGADPVYVAGPLAVTAAEVAALAAEGPASFRLSGKSVETVTASAPGATAYRWTRNGVVVGETDGALGIGWRKALDPDTFTVTPVYRTASGAVDGQPASFEVSYLPESFLILFR